MCTTEREVTGSWVSRTCTLPTTEQPLRVAEFDNLFAAARAVEQPELDRISIEFDPDPQTVARAADLAARETSCCSFFTFTLIATGAALRLEISVPPGQHEVLDALAVRAKTAAAGAAT